MSHAVPRRVLWTLDDASREVVLGVCVPVDALRQAADDVAGRCHQVGDYALHMAVVAQCAQANALSTAIQQLLELRFAPTIALFERQAERRGMREEIARLRRGGQTGCLSHNAYWRVQDHCRRTGKQCMQVDFAGQRAGGDLPGP